MSSHPVRSSAPLGVQLLAGLIVIDGLMSLLVGLSALVKGDIPVAILIGGFSLLQMTVAVGLWTLEPYAWGVAAFGTASVLVVEVATGHLPGALLSGGLLAYLLVVRDEFET
jgi:hypothetical protein